MGKYFVTLIFLTVFSSLSKVEVVGQEVVVYTSVDRLFSGPVLKDFEGESGIKVKAIFDTEEAKSTGIVNRLIAERSNPQADVFWSGDPVRPILLEKRGMLEPYKSPNARDIPDIYKDEKGYWTGFSARVRAIIYNKNLVKPKEIPKSIFDFLKPRWSGRVAIANPLFGTTTIHAAALFVILGDEEATQFFEALKANDVRIVSSNGEVRRLVSRGEVAAGITDTDDVNVAMLEGAPVGMIYPDQEGMGALLMPNMVCMIKNGPNPENAKRLLDFLLSAEVEEKLAHAECVQIPLRPWVTGPENIVTIRDIEESEVDYREVANKLEEIYPYLKKWSGY
ncbi:MAG: extracellular solute-binding protein [Candidatus Brocadiales bacterium]|nr:extracellular solute-binding protein [Candidatus Bathyanammoxibius amoris]